MNARSELNQLINELHNVNEELAEAALPLQWLDELSRQHRDKIREQIHAGVRRWGRISERINDVLREDATS